MANRTLSAQEHAQAVITQLNDALLQKDMLQEQLANIEDRVKALRNMAAGIDIGRKAAIEAAIASSTTELPPQA